MSETEILYDRVTQRLTELGMTANQLSVAVSGKGYVVRDIRNGSMPRLERLMQMADVLGTSVDWLRGRTDAHPPPALPAPGTVAAPGRAFTSEPPVFGQTLNPQPVTGSPLDLPKNVPVVGNAIGTSADFSNGTPGRMELIEMGEVVEHVRRPPGIADVKKAYALYIMGDSQAPRFEPGELVYVHPHRPVAPGDDVVVQLVDDDDCTNCALVKRLVRRTADGLILRQFNPPHDFTVPMARVRAIHRILNFAELYGY